jgi:hypothetical protein
MNFIVGVIVGVVLATVGVSGVIRYVDLGVNQTQAIVRSVTQ